MMTIKSGRILLVVGAAVASLLMAACQKKEAVDNAAADAFSSGAPSTEAMTNIATDDTVSTNAAAATNSTTPSAGQ